MSWKRVCKASDVLADSLKQVSVDGIALLIVNYGRGWRAIPPLCPHMEEPLEASGVLAECRLTCTKHHNICLFEFFERSARLCNDTHVRTNIA